MYNFVTHIDRSAVRPQGPLHNINSSHHTGANPGGTHRIDDHFLVFVPDARARNPVTKSNWEGAGVKPDIAIERDRALATAYGLALDAKIHDQSRPAAYRDGVAKLRAKLDTLTDADILAL